MSTMIDWVTMVVPCRNSGVVDGGVGIAQGGLQIAQEAMKHGNSEAASVESWVIIRVLAVAVVSFFPGCEGVGRFRAVGGRWP